MLVYLNDRTDPGTPNGQLQVCAKKKRSIAAEKTETTGEKTFTTSNIMHIVPANSGRTVLGAYFH